MAEEALTSQEITAAKLAEGVESNGVPVKVETNYIRRIKYKLDFFFFFLVKNTYNYTKSTKSNTIHYFLCQKYYKLYYPTIENLTRITIVLTWKNIVFPHSKIMILVKFSISMKQNDGGNW